MPFEEEFFRLGEGRTDRWSYAPGQLEILEEMKRKAREAGLWNFFLPNAETARACPISTTLISRRRRARAIWPPKA